MEMDREVPCEDKSTMHTNKFLKLIALIHNQLSFLLMAAAGFALLLMILHVTSDVVARSLFNKSVPGAVELVAWYYMLGVIFLPIAATDIGGRHIVVDLFFNMFRNTIQRIVSIVASALTCVFFSLFAIRAWQDALRSFERNEMADGAIFILVWPARIGVATGLSIGAIAAAISLVLAVNIFCFDNKSQSNK